MRDTDVLPVGVVWSIARWLPWLKWRFVGRTSIGGSTLSIETHNVFWQASTVRAAQVVATMTLIIVLGVAIGFVWPPRLSGIGFVALGALYLGPVLGLVATVVTLNRQQATSAFGAVGASGPVDSSVLAGPWLAAGCCVALMIMGFVRWTTARPKPPDHDAG